MLGVPLGRFPLFPLFSHEAHGAAPAPSLESAEDDTQSTDHVRAQLPTAVAGDGAQSLASVVFHP